MYAVADCLSYFRSIIEKPPLIIASIHQFASSPWAYRNLRSVLRSQNVKGSSKQVVWSTKSVSPQPLYQTKSATVAADQQPRCSLSFLSDPAVAFGIHRSTQWVWNEP